MAYAFTLLRTVVSGAGERAAVCGEIDAPEIGSNEKEDMTMSGQTAGGESAVVLSNLHEAMNRHDLDGFLACFDENYQSEQPVHPDRGFGGRAQVEKNWSSIFSGIPDFRAELLRSAETGDECWAEWRWTGTRADAKPMDLRGVTIFGVRGGRLVWGRLYMANVEQSGSGIDAAVRAMASGASSQESGS